MQFYKVALRSHEWQNLGETTTALMAKPSSSSSSSSATPFLTAASPAIQINDISEELLRDFVRSFNRMAGSGQIPDDCNAYGFHSDLIRTLLRQPRLERGRVSCILSVKPAVCNLYGTIHGGFVAAVAEFLSIACARTVVAEDRDIFLGELSVSYLSGAPQNADVVVDASILKSGRNLTIVAVEFKLHETGNLIYTARSTLYNNMPIAKL